MFELLKQNKNVEYKKGIWDLGPYQNNDTLRHGIQYNVIKYNDTQYRASKC
jgi:hypothetical protein